jgi:signal transduction histidine kinase
MKRRYTTFMILIFLTALFAKSEIDSLKMEINKIDDAYMKADRTWDLAFAQYKHDMIPESLESFCKTSDMFVKIDSMRAAIKSQVTALHVSIFREEYYAYSDTLFDRAMDIIDLNTKCVYDTSYVLQVFHDYTGTRYVTSQFSRLNEILKRIDKYVEEVDSGLYKLLFKDTKLQVVKFYQGDEAFLDQALALNNEIMNSDIEAPYAIKQQLIISNLNSIQNLYFERGDLAESNKLLSQALKLAKETYEDKDNLLSTAQKTNFRNTYGTLLTLWGDNVEIKEENLPELEKRYMTANTFIKKYDKQAYYNNYAKIIHAYDVVYSGKSPVIKKYLNELDSNIDKVKRLKYIVNIKLTKARYFMNLKQYKEADKLFTEIENYIFNLNQSWLEFNYVLERSRYYFETNEPKKGYDLVVEFYTSIDKDFANDLSEKTAELNANITTTNLATDKELLEKKLEIESLKHNQKNLLAVIAFASLVFASFILINRVQMNKKLKQELKEKSSRLKSEMQLTQKQTEQLILAEKLSSIGQIASSIAHEIKNPITNSLTAVRLISKDLTSEEIDKYKEISERNSWIAVDKINALLDFSKKKELEVAVVALKDIMREAYELSKGSIENSDINLVMTYKSFDDKILADKKELSGVLVNLILNSIQAFDESTVDKKIELTCEDQGEMIKLSVTDNASGIPEEFLDKVLDPFFTTKDGGTGLGLNYTQKVVNYHNGKIEVHSQVNVGTVIDILLQKANF